MKVNRSTLALTAVPVLALVSMSATALGGAKAQAVSPVTVIGKQLQLERRGASRRFVGRPATYENVIQNETTFDAFDEMANIIKKRNAITKTYRS